MTPRKRKSSKIVLKKEEEKPEIALEFSEELKRVEKTEKKEERKENNPNRGEKIKENIDKVKVKEGIIGYILRNSKSASIDLKDPTKIIDYAVLSSSATEASEELSNTFELGDVKYVLVEGNTVKLLSLTTGENRVSVFMEKNVDHNPIFKDLLS